MYVCICIHMSIYTYEYIYTYAQESAASVTSCKSQGVLCMSESWRGGKITLRQSFAIYPPFTLPSWSKLQHPPSSSTAKKMTITPVQFPDKTTNTK